jgi:hypothetical protein
MKIKAILISAVATGLLGGCEGNYGVGYYGPPGEAIAYDGYYDDYYGPIYDGYWNNDVFFYRNHAGDQFRRDDSQHVRREATQGFHHIGGTAHVQHNEHVRG